MKTIFLLSIAYLFLSGNISAQCWQQVATGEEHTLAIRSNGTLWAWGWNANGQLGRNPFNDQSVPFQVDTAITWQQVTGGYQHSAGIKQDGTLWTWGNNDFGQLGDGTLNDHYEPLQIGTATNWRQVSATSGSNLAIKTDGTLWAWGQNLQGILGNGNDINQLAPIQIGTDHDWQQVAPSGYHKIVALKTDGSLWKWGDFNNNNYKPQQVGTAHDWQQVTASIYGAGFALKTDGTLWDWQTNLQIGTDQDWRQGSGFYAIKNDGTLWNVSVPPQLPLQVGVANDWQQVEARSGYVEAIKTDGSLWAWGNNNSKGQLGIGTNGIPIFPQLVDHDTTWQQVSASVWNLDGNLAIKSDGSLWTWGKYTNLLLEDTSTSLLYFPTLIDQQTDWQQASGNTVIKSNGSLWLLQTTNGQVGTDLDWQQVATYSDHTAALKDDGSLWNWDQTTPLPQPVGTDQDWKQVAAGTQHTMLIRNDSTLWGWGGNSWGQLGDGTYIDRNEPVQIGSDHWQQVTATTAHTLAIKTDGTLWSWGDNSSHQLGLGNIGEQNKPVKVGNATDWKQVATSGYQSIAIKNDGTLWAWGYIAIDYYYHLSYYTPHQIGLDNNWNQVAVGLNHSTLIKNDGTLWNWGQNTYSIVDYSLPAEVACEVTGTNLPFQPAIQVRILPNPARNYITVQAIDMDVAELQFEIRNLLGETVYTRQKLMDNQQVEVEKLTPGLYILILSNKEGQTARQFVKM